MAELPEKDGFVSRVYDLESGEGGGNRFWNILYKDLSQYRGFFEEEEAVKSLKKSEEGRKYNLDAGRLYLHKDEIHCYIQKDFAKANADVQYKVLA